MEMLNTISTLLSNNLWTIIINFFADWIVNYGWAIVVFTICLKLVLTPLDVLQKTASQKQARVTAAMKPEMDALQAKYGNDREKLNQEQNKLYKKYNVNMGGMCLPMLISLVLTMVIFFTLFSSINSWGNEKLYSSYKELDKTYVSAVDEYTTLTEPELTEEEFIKKAVQDKYEELGESNSWLWVKNVWKSDTNTSQFVSFNDYAKNQKLKDEAKTEAKARYDDIVGWIQTEEGDQNGYYVLIILAAVITFLTQFISQKLLAPKGQKLNTMNKVMMIIMPVMMLIFAFNSNVVFALYIITNSVMSAIISTVISLIMRRKQKNTPDGDILLPKKHVEVVEYSRNYKK